MAQLFLRFWHRSQPRAPTPLPPGRNSLSLWTGDRVGLIDGTNAMTKSRIPPSPGYGTPVLQSTSWSRIMSINLPDRLDYSTFQKINEGVMQTHKREFIHFKENLSSETSFPVVTHFKTCEEVLQSQTLDKSIETCVYCPISHVTFISAYRPICLLNPPHNYSSPCVHRYHLMSPSLLTNCPKQWATTSRLREVPEVVQ